MERCWKKLGTARGVKGESKGKEMRDDEKK